MRPGLLTGSAAACLCARGMAVGMRGQNLEKFKAYIKGEVGALLHTAPPVLAPSVSPHPWLLLSRITRLLLPGCLLPAGDDDDGLQLARVRLHRGSARHRQRRACRPQPAAPARAPPATYGRSASLSMGRQAGAQDSCTAPSERRASVMSEGCVCGGCCRGGCR